MYLSADEITRALPSELIKLGLKRGKGILRHRQAQKRAQKQAQGLQHIGEILPNFINDIYKLREGAKKNGNNKTDR